MLKSTAERLAAAREVVSDPRVWLRRYLAKDKRGHWVFPPSPDAVQFCSLGAFVQETGDAVQAWREWTKHVDPVAMEMYGKNAVAVNNHQSHECVLKMLDAAVKRMRENETPA